MKKFTKNTVIDFDLYQRHLQYLSEIYLDYDLAIAYYNEAHAKMDSYRNQTHRYIKAMSGGTCRNVKRDTLYKYLLYIEKCPAQMFATNKNQSGWTVNRKEVLEPLYNMGYATEFFNHYFAYGTYKSLDSDIYSLITAHSFETEKVNVNGKRLLSCPYFVNQKTNFRYNYSNHDIITIPTWCKDIVTVPKGKVLVWGDFAQADLRSAYNIFIRDEDNIKVVKSCDDMYEAMARIIYGDEFNLEDFKKKRNMMKAVILSCVYGKRSDFESEKTEFLQAFGRYLDEHCSKYKEYKERIKQHKAFRSQIVLNTYFGETTIVDQSVRWGKKVEYQCLNYPIQSSTSLIVILTVNTLLKQFYDLGYTEDQIGVYYTRHDEPIFIMDEELMEDSWIFKDFHKIFIDDWYPMQLDFEFGYYYSVPNTELQDKYEESVKRNQYRIKEEVESEPVDDNFLPLKELYNVYVGVATAYDGDTIATLYDAENKQCQYLKFKPSEGNLPIKATLAWEEDAIYARGYGGVIVNNNILEETVSYKKLVYRYKKGYVDKVPVAYMLAEYMRYRHAVKNNASYTMSELCSLNIDNLKGVKTVNALLSE